jgi:hypothetical protein
VINHIQVYRDVRDYGPQVLVASKQIYANHYFNSSLALTGFVSVAGATPAAFLVYENRSRTDGLQGAFSKFKRRMIENKAVDGLKSILEHSRLNLDGSAVEAGQTGELVLTTLRRTGSPLLRYRTGDIVVQPNRLRVIVAGTLGSIRGGAESALPVLAAGAVQTDNVAYRQACRRAMRDILGPQSGYGQ